MRTKFKGILTLLLAFVVQLTFAQEKTITGQVVDADGLPVPGVNVIIKNTTQGTQTDFDGNFSISASSNQTLVFSYVGFTTQEIRVESKSTINVTMEPNLEELDEVVVTSYQGILKESEVVSSSSNVKSEDIEQVPIASIDQVLQGNVAGANVRQASGQPGQSANVIIRGRTSINGDTEPLYIVDGMPVNKDNFRSLNSNDIESMRVLKDAAATAIYGNRGAAGVILITTKTAKRNSNLSVQYRGLYGESNLTDSNIDMMNSGQFLNYQKNLLPGNQFADGLSDEVITAISNQTNTQWEDIILRSGKTESHDLVITQGGENMSSYTSMQYFEQEGTTLRSKLQRFTVRNNLSGGDDKFRYGTNLTAAFSKSDFVVDAERGDNTGGQLDNPFIVPFLALPYLDPYNGDGSLNRFGTVRSGALNSDGSVNVSGANGFINTPFIALNTAAFNTDRENEFRITGSANAEYDILKNITIGSTIGVDYLNIERLFIDSPNSIRGLLSPNQGAAEEFFGGQQSESFRRDFSFNTNAFIRYSNVFAEKHSLTATLFSEYFYRNIQTASFTAFGLNPKFPGSSAGFVDPSTFFPDLDAETPAAPFIPSVGSFEAETSLYSYFGNVNYDYDGRFGLDLTLRRDGTSRFQEDQRWGTFFSAGGRWNIDQESFMDDVSWVDALKLRGSYGQTGNQGIGFFAGFQTIAGGNGFQNNPILNVNTLADTNVQWETTTQANIGIDFGLWNNKLTGSLDVYDKQTEDLFFPLNISTAGTGFTDVETNVGDMQNQGVEVQLSYDILRKSSTNPWGVRVFGNFAYNENEVLDIRNEQGFTGNTARIQEGRRIFSYFYQRWAGVDPSNGQPLYLDAEGELTTDYDPDTHGVYVDKQFDPVYTGGFGANITWKNFSLNGLFSFAADTYRNNGTYAITEDASLAANANQNVTMLDAWQQPGDVTSIPSLAFGGLRFESGDRYLEDASFLRLRNATLAYNVDKKTLDKVGFLSAVRVFAQGTNLVTWSKWRGYDPETDEVGDFFNFPSPVTVSFGVDITF